ncbi:unnamed protein product [Caenorhabditis brenneri]
MSSSSIVPTSFPGIYGNSSYLEYQFSIFTLPGLLLFPPILYMPITVIIILRIFVKLRYAVKDKNVNVPLFTAICISQFMCLLFFVCDFFYIRLMTAGAFTRWCASAAPNGYIIILYVFTYYVNYATMLFPFLVSTMRIVLFVYPQNQAKINGKILRVALPLIAIYPSFSTFFMITAVGYCSQTRGPYPFGSVILGFQGSLFGITSQLGGDLTYYAIMLRPFGNDLETCVVPWINKKILKSSIPIIFIYPIFFTFFMIPAVGFCVQAAYPFTFGAVTYHFEGTWFGLKNSYFLLYNNLFWMFICGIMNAVLLVKLIILKVSLSQHARSHYSYRTELSLTLTTISMFFYYLANGMVVCLLFFIADFLYIRLPITGMLTSWCARIEPNGYLVILLIITYHINYSVMLLPFLVALIRLILIMMPQRHQKINGKLLKWSVPIVALYPLLFTFIMFPSTAYCEPAGYPLPFGSIIFRVKNTYFGITNGLSLMFNTFFWLFACLLINSILVIKLIKLKFILTREVNSQMSHKAEISLTVICLSMTFSYVTNGMIAIGGILIPNSTFYFIMLRPFMNDLDTCIVPWLFYLTHPVFKKAPPNQVLVSSRDRINS